MKHYHVMPSEGGHPAIKSAQLCCAHNQTPAVYILLLQDRGGDEFKEKCLVFNKNDYKSLQKRYYPCKKARLKTHAEAADYLMYDSHPVFFQVKESLSAEV